jgi:prephenate dehydratase
MSLFACFYNNIVASYDGMKVAIQGQQASFHDIAARQFFGDDIVIVGRETFAETFGALASGRADRAVVAIENSLYGSMNEVYDLLLRHKFWIAGEVYSRINQCLIGLPGATLENIQEVYSMGVALGQCEEFLDTRLPNAKRVEHHDTTGSVIDVKRWDDPTKAAVAGEAAAKFHGMQILAEEIETHKQNYTRFMVLQHEQTEDSAANKTSLILVTDHKPGALYQALGTFAGEGISLTKLQSRPIIGEAWHYMFYVDVDAGVQTTSLQKALDELHKQNCEVIILGSYRNGSSA